VGFSEGDVGAGILADPNDQSRSSDPSVSSGIGRIEGGGEWGDSREHSNSRSRGGQKAFPCLQDPPSCRITERDDRSGKGTRCVARNRGRSLAPRGAPPSPDQISNKFP